MKRAGLLFALLCVMASPGVPPALAGDPLDRLFEQTRVKREDVRVDFPGAASVPLFDAHNHLNADVQCETLVSDMDRAGVRSMVLMPRLYTKPSDGGRATDEQALECALRFPGRFIPFIGGQRDEMGPLRRTWSDPQERHHLLWGMEEKLKTAPYRGLGEFILVHHAYNVPASTQTGGELRIAADQPLMIAIAGLGAKYRVPVLFHAEAEPDAVEPVHRLFKAAPDTKFIWAHNCGRGSAGQVRGFLEAYPNLLCDLGGMHNGPRTRGGYGTYWPRKTPWIHLVMDENGRVLPDMKALFEAFPERFVIGADNAHTPAKKWYGYHMAIFRIMLAQLSPPAARRIAFENARALFAGPGAAK
ncbi:MAG: amidohydrolase family protein [Syntrophales bacterium]|jgi:hypothetical protein|nr:amidohydrolase family protein [Syntrophales bacterium]